MMTLWALMRRELWESPGTFRWLPLVLAILVLVVMLLPLGFIGRIDAGFSSTLDGLRMFAEQDYEFRRNIVFGGLVGIAAFFNVALLFVIFFYLAGSLYDDRKDRTILFWKSLPVSDSATVASKLLTACLLLPAFYLAGILIAQVLILLLATGYSLAAGVNAWTTLWQPAGLPGLWLGLVVGYLVQALWIMPLFGWVMLCSAWAPRFPVLIAVAVPLIIGLVQHYYSFLTRMRFAEGNVLEHIGTRLAESTIPLEARVETEAGNVTFMSGGQIAAEEVTRLGYLASRLTDSSLWIGIAIGLLFLAGAVWGRKRATDN